MRDLNFQLKILCNRAKDGSFATQADRLYLLNIAANDLHDIGHRGLDYRNLNSKHINALLTHWKQQGLTAGTLKNRMAALRWWLEKIGKPNLIPKNNDALNIEPRQYVTKENKAISLSDDVLDSIPDINIRCSLELQKAFGLRREEALKFQPAYSIQEDEILLKGSWCKGGRPRSVPIRNDYQRAVLKRARLIAGLGSMIPPRLKFAQQVKKYENICRQHGLSKMHGLRHKYAQTRYEELTGWKAPKDGGPTKKELSPEQQIKDKEVRKLIAEELGHGRIDVTNTYLGH